MSFNTSQSAHVDFRDLVRERTKPVVAWIGSGLSTPAGLPSWERLKELLVEALAKKIATLESADQPKLSAIQTRVEKEHDYWLSFELLEKGLGVTTFRDTIKKTLQVAPRCEVPAAYKHLWHMGLSGTISLNLDRLTTRAYAQIHKAEVQEFNGFEVDNSMHVLQSPRPFILNLHGIAENYQSWVFTKARLNSLMKHPGYQEFIKACLVSRTVLFVGISADDLAVGGHLQKLRGFRSGLGTHYWVTSRRDAGTDSWAEANGIRVIRYAAKDDDHSELLEFFEDIGSFLPKDEPAPPVILPSDAVPEGKVPPPEDLVMKDADIIRDVLNQEAARLLAPNTRESYEDFEKFCRKYDEAIYRAWYTSLSPGANRLLGYTLEEKRGKGAFGTVYRARTSDGRPVAIKILNQEVRLQPEMVQSFRRGVRSMRILSEANMANMVPYLEASEIPTFAVMDWIDGPNLREVVEARQIDSWQLRLQIGCTLSGVLRHAHALPQRVLHRDLRPSNVMLKEFYTDTAMFELVVLDFDLSWHLGSEEKSIMLGAETTGYLAPEQLQSIQGVSTRHAAVDAFGLGMTLFFLISGRDPLPTEHQHRDWPNSVKVASGRWPCDEWRSLPDRFGRAILNCTRHEQHARWDVAQLDAELQRLVETLNKPEDVASAELLAEELVARSEYGNQYSWNDERLCAEVVLPSGIAFCVRPDEAKAQVRASISWASGGEHSRKQIQKWLPAAGSRVAEALTSRGWKLTERNEWGGEIHFEACLGLRKLRKDIPRAVDALNRALTNLRFD